MRKAAISIVILLVVIAGVVFFVLTSLDRIVAQAIEHYGSSATQTDVRVSSVKIQLKAGEGSVSGLSIANPPGFSTPHAFSLGSISIRLDTGSVTKDPVVIEEIRVSQPQVTYEIDAKGRSNINVLKDNIQKAPAEKKPEKEPEGKKRNLALRKLIVEQGKIDVRVAVKPGEPLTVNLPRIELSNLGGTQGQPPDRIAKEILTVLMRDAGSAAAKAGISTYLGTSMEEVKADMKREVEKKVSESLDSATKEAGKTIKKFLGR